MEKLNKDTINSETEEQKKVMKRMVKDSVFTDLFQNKKYLLQLYKALHPEDHVTEDDLTDVTIKNVLTDNIYNDLGFVVEDRLMIFGRGTVICMDSEYHSPCADVSGADMA